MKKIKKVIDIGVGKTCHKCEQPTVIRKSIKPTSYYSQWEFCKSCNAVYFEEKYITKKGVDTGITYNTYNISLF